MCESKHCARRGRQRQQWPPGRGHVETLAVAADGQAGDRRGRFFGAVAFADVSGCRVIDPYLAAVAKVQRLAVGRNNAGIKAVAGALANGRRSESGLMPEVKVLQAQFSNHAQSRVGGVDGAAVSSAR